MPYVPDLSGERTKKTWLLPVSITSEIERIADQTGNPESHLVAEFLLKAINARRLGKW